MFKIPNIDDNVKVLNIIQIHIAPVLINPFNVCYIIYIHINLKYYCII